MSQSHPTDDLRVAEILPLIQPALLMHEYPLRDAEAAFVEESRKKSEAILPDFVLSMVESELEKHTRNMVA